jgi:hypothetical protein
MHDAEKKARIEQLYAIAERERGSPDARHLHSYRRAAGRRGRVGLVPAAADALAGMTAGGLGVPGDDVATGHRPLDVSPNSEASRLAFASTPSIHPGLPVKAPVLSRIRSPIRATSIANRVTSASSRGCGRGLYRPAPSSQTCPRLPVYVCSRPLHGFASTMVMSVELTAPASRRPRATLRPPIPPPIIVTGMARTCSCPRPGRLLVCARRTSDPESAARSPGMMPAEAASRLGWSVTIVVLQENRNRMI